MTDGGGSHIDLSKRVLNPIWVRSARARLRLKHILSWGIIALTVTAFISVVSYLPAVERGITPANAAKLMILPLIVIQGIILMLLGTGAVAGQLSIEREKGLLDYVRMTPMTPLSKIMGYLFGLPVREYFLFALTLPFLAFAIVVSGVSPLKMLHFYAVFFSSVWLYHMTALVAGMASSKPRHAAMMAQGLVVLLYLVLPQLSRFGMTFFEFLTVRPTFFAMVGAELASANPQLDMAARQQFSGLDQSGSVPFFTLDIHATVFSLMVQLLLLGALLQVVRRKWRDGFSHALSKLDAIVLYAGVLFLLTGSLWPVLGDPQITDRLRMQFGGTEGMAPDAFLFAVLLVFLLVCGAGMLLVIAVTTPNRFTQLRELRRTRKLALKRIPINADGATALSVVALGCALTAVVYTLVLGHALDSRLFLAQGPGLWATSAPVLYFCFAALFTQGIREQFSARAVGVSLFLFWMIPFFVAVVLTAAFDAFVAASYATVPCPPLGITLTLLHFFKQAAPLGNGSFVSGEVVPHLPAITILAVGFYGVLALGAQLRLQRTKTLLRTQESRLREGRTNDAKQIRSTNQSD